MEFSGDIAAIQQQLAGCWDMTLRRQLVLDAMGLAPGERALEVGCGGGLLLREIGQAVGASGAVLGLDLSADQVAAARAHCPDLEQVTVPVGDVRDLPDDDGSFDATVSVQILEYVADVGAALAELARVTRPAGRFVNVATNWGALFWTGGDPGLTAAVLAAWEHHAPHPNLPVQLPSLLTPLGFGSVTQSPSRSSTGTSSPTPSAGAQHS